MLLGKYLVLASISLRIEKHQKTEQNYADRQLDSAYKISCCCY